MGQYLFLCGRLSWRPRVVIALVVTPEGFPLAYEVLPGNTADCTTLRVFLRKIEAQYGKAGRIWVMDRGIPTEEVLAEMRQAFDAAIGRSGIWTAEAWQLLLKHDHPRARR